eukprot:8482112-Pyramimonas_sp.AAC.1
MSSDRARYRLFAILLLHLLSGDHLSKCTCFSSKSRRTLHAPGERVRRMAFTAITESRYSSYYGTECIY